MRKFVFDLEKLLEIRGYAEKEKLLALAEVTGRYMQIVNSIEDSEKRKDDIMGLRFSGSDVDVYTIMFDQSRISAIERKISDFKKKLIPINKEKEEKRLEYLEALKNKKVLEKLKEKEASEHKRKELLREAKEIDDIVSSNFDMIQEV
ncbi:MAG: flagellar export protein FliJ [Spirochaetaceae bacterium]|nr:flagellar export protein FliJ [Spirochaetaceae bacterium]